MKPKLKQLKAALANALSYAEWREVAIEHDRCSGMDAWKNDEFSPDYNWQLIKSKLDELRRLRRDSEVLKLAFALHEGLHGNLANIASPTLYQHAKFGTKKLMTDYIEEVALTLNYLCVTDFPEFPPGDKIRFFSRLGKSFGRSALLLSGGATLGMYHSGVVKAIFDEALLPRVISGSSAGSIIAGVVGTHADHELAKIFDPKYLSLQAWRALGIRGTLKHRSVMDGQQLADCIRDNVGDFSFEEAFEYTGRIVNITVSPADPHEQSRMLNYLTSPNVLVRRASLASCAVPGLFPPVELEAKDFYGNSVAYMPGRRWVDGSIEADLPMLRLSRMHNANHYIVSQTNPYVVPFLSDKKKKTGLIAFARDLVTSNSRNTIRLAREHMGPNVVSNLLGKVHSVASQKYQGDVTIFPTQPPSRLLKMISNPTPQDIDTFIIAGQRATWPKLERIRNSSLISRTLDTCLLQLKARSYGRTPSKTGEKVVQMAQRVLRL